MKIAAWVRPEETFYEKSVIPNELEKMRKAGISNLYLLARHRDKRVYYGPHSTVGYDVLKEVNKLIPEYGIEAEVWMAIFVGHDPSDTRLNVRNIDGALWSVTLQAMQIRINEIQVSCQEYNNFCGYHVDYARSPEKGKHHFGTEENLTYIVNTAVSEARRVTSAAGKKLSTAVYVDEEGGYGTEYEKRRINQDWNAWLNMGFLDKIVPMIYTSDKASLEKRAARANKIVAGRAELSIGIGVNSDRLYRVEHRMLSLEEFKEQLDILNESGIQGVSVLSWFGIDKPEFLRLVKQYSG